MLTTIPIEGCDGKCDKMYFSISPVGISGFAEKVKKSTVSSSYHEKCLNMNYHLCHGVTQIQFLPEGNIRKLIFNDC